MIYDENNAPVTQFICKCKSAGSNVITYYNNISITNVINIHEL